jgi:hypothetical protein
LDSGFYVPLYEYHPKPGSPDESLANVKLAFDFLADLGGLPSRNRPADIVRGDLKAVLRIIFTLFVRHKQQQQEQQQQEDS